MKITEANCRAITGYDMWFVDMLWDLILELQKAMDNKVFKNKGQLLVLLNYYKYKHTNTHCPPIHTQGNIAI